MSAHASGRLLALLFGSIAWMLVAPPALGQTGVLGLGRDGGWPDVRVRFGWDGYLRPERVIPVEVELSGGTRSFSGLVILRYRQDGSQWASVHAPAASTPGRTTYVRVLGVFPTDTSEVEVELVDLSGSSARVVRRLTVDQTTRPVGALIEAMPDLGLVLYTGRSAARSGVEGVGRAALTQSDVPSVLSAHRGRVGSTFGDTHAERWARVRTVRVDPVTLAETWAAYDGVEVIVLDADAEVSEPQLLAIRRWVEGGGRLVVLASGPGAGWQRFVPEGVTFGASAVHALPTGVASALDTQRRIDARTARLGTLAPGMRGQADEAADEDAVTELALELASREAPLVDRVTARRVVLAQTRRDAGWRPVWGDDAAEGAALGAMGPMGFGRVLVLGVSPGSLARTPDSELEGRLWRAAIGVVLEDWLARPIRDKPSWRMSVMPSGADAVERLAFGWMLDRTAVVEPVRWRFALAIGIGVLVLALLVGPVDAFVLKRARRRTWSWATALGWTSVASVAAVWMPLTMRDGQTRGDRVLVVDTLMPSPGEAGLAWGEGVAGIYAGRSGLVEVGGESTGGGAGGGGAVWRGVSSVGSSMPARRGGMGELAMFQRDGGLSIGGVRVSVWSFRTFADHGELDAAVTARVQRNGADAWVVELDGLPRGAIVRTGMLRVGEVWFTLGVQNRVDDDGRLVLRGSVPDAHDTHRIFEPEMLVHGRDSRYPGRAQSRDRLSAMGVPGAWRRSAAIESRVNSGAWAAVYLQLHETSADGAWAGDRGGAFPGGWSTRLTLHRVVTPLHPVDRVPTERGAAPEPENEGSEGGR